MSTDSATTRRPISERFLSLDVFRGMSIFGMIVVNVGGTGGARPFRELAHTPWLGFTFADLIFPSFLFAVGTALSFVSARIGEDRAFVLKLLRRAAVIFLLGFLMYLFPFFHRLPDGHWAWNAWSQARLMGVLQRIALAYAFAALATRYLKPPALVALCVALLLGYWALMVWGSPPGMALDKLNNLGTRIDRAVLGQHHLYRKDGGFDPEGLLGTLPSIVNVIAGFLCGHYLRRHGKHTRTTVAIALVGGLLLGLALLWNPWFPIAKKLWTSSFVLCTVGLDLLVLAALVQWIEVAGHPRGSRFFIVLGKNALVIYLLSELLAVALNMIPCAGTGLFDWVAVHVFQRLVPGPVGALLTSLIYTMLCWLVAWWMDRRRLYVRL